METELEVRLSSALPMETDFEVRNSVTWRVSLNTYKVKGTVMREYIIEKKMRSSGGKYINLHIIF